MTSQQTNQSASKKTPDLMSEIGMDMKEISRRMSFIGMSNLDVALLSEMKDFGKKYADQVVSAFYKHLLAFREPRLLLKDQGTIDRLKSSQKNYLIEVFQGRFDKAYFERRIRVGAVHHRIGLKPKWFLDAYAFYENTLSSLIAEAYQHEADRGLARDQALRKIFRIDMVLALEYYQYSANLEMTTKIKSNVQGIDDFTRMLSHDLKEPLRGIEAFSSFLLEDYASLLDPQGKRYLNFLKESSTRMKDLIHDLLTLVSIPEKSLHADKVDLNILLNQVKQDLDFAIKQKQVVLSSKSPLPIVRCDPIQVAEVFKNLISNAIKFNSSSPPIVEVAAKERAGFFQLSVKDNGIGIKSSYQDQVLLPFERLHHYEEFEGTGVGLAICKKVVENYGGKIWLESEEGLGSIFYFTLPKEEQD